MNTEEIDLFFSYNVKNSLDKLIITYYSIPTPEETREKIFDAGAAFWWPLAMRDSEPENFSFYALGSIYKLKKKQEEIKQHWEKIAANYQGNGIESRGSEFKFRYREKNADKKAKKLLNYLVEEGGLFSSAQKLFWSSYAYWGFWAAIELGESPKEVEKIKDDVIKQLEKHISFLEDIKETATFSDSSRKLDFDLGEFLHGVQNYLAKGTPQMPSTEAVNKEETGNEEHGLHLDLLHSPLDDELKWE